MNYCKFTFCKFKWVSKFPIKLWEKMPTLYTQPEVSIQKLIVKHYLKVKKNPKFYIIFLKYDIKICCVGGHNSKSAE